MFKVIRTSIQSSILTAVFALSLCATPCDALELSFNFIYDSTFTTLAGSQETAAKADFAYVGNYIGSMINPTLGTPVTIDVDVTGSNDSGSGTLASAGSSFFTTANTFQAGLTQMKIQGTTKFWAGSEANASINFGQDWGYGGVVASNQFDFRYVLLHEMFHALGFYSLVNSLGESHFGGNNFSYYDQYVQGWDGSQYVNLVTRDGSGNPTGTIANAASAVVDSAHPLLFNGPNVTAQLGGPSELYTPSTFSQGSSISHYNYPGQLEYYATTTGAKTFGFSNLDQAFLKDFGYVVVPEPSTIVLTIVGIGVMFSVTRFRKPATPV